MTVAVDVRRAWRRWRFGVTVSALGVSTKLLYIRPG